MALDDQIEHESNSLIGQRRRRFLPNHDHYNT
jgi:hypothetical protein